MRRYKWSRLTVEDRSIVLVVDMLGLENTKIAVFLKHT